MPSQAKAFHQLAAVATRAAMIAMRGDMDFGNETVILLRRSQSPGEMELRKKQSIGSECVSEVSLPGWTTTPNAMRSRVRTIVW